VQVIAVALYAVCSFISQVTPVGDSEVNFSGFQINLPPVTT